MDSKCKAWVAVGLDPVNQRLTVLGFSDTSAEDLRLACEGRRGEFDTTTVLEFTSPQLGMDLYQFLRGCKVVHDEATALIRKFGCEMARLTLIDEQETNDAE